MITGKVEKITSNKAGYFSIKVGENWYGVGKKTPPCNEGSYIKFESTSRTVGDRTYYDADMSTLEQVAAPVATPEKSEVAASLSKDDYWTRKEERDVVTQTKISFQGARNAAIQVATFAFDKGLVAAKKADMNLDLLLSLVDELTVRFAADTEAFAATGLISENKVVAQKDDNHDD